MTPYSMAPPAAAQLHRQPSSSPEQTVRQRLGRDTRVIHEALHHAGPFAKLPEGAWSVADYQTVLLANARCLAALEGQRVALDNPWPEFTLSGPLEALTNDLMKLGYRWPSDLITGGVTTGESSPSLAGLHNHNRLLGALYVMHGSQFGRSELRKTLAALLPDQPLDYFSLPADVATWRLLCEALESRGGHDQNAYADLHRGASIMFCAMAQALSYAAPAVVPAGAVA